MWIRLHVMIDATALPPIRSPTFSLSLVPLFCLLLDYFYFSLCRPELCVRAAVAGGFVGCAFEGRSLPPSTAGEVLGPVRSFLSPLAVLLACL